MQGCTSVLINYLHKNPSRNKSIFQGNMNSTLLNQEYNGCGFHNLYYGLMTTK
jgi:hypothetical protein